MSSYADSKTIGIWLFTCAAMIALMVAIGGYTRLSHSGLSIVEWKPITGSLPPLSEAKWQQEFDKYQASPEYQKINYGMNLNEFKKIYLVEYIHRLAGRITGLVFLVPMLYFLFRKTIPPILIKKLLLIFSLGLMQGWIGWYMVKSGLNKDPHVSHLRLALHLATAFLIYGLIFWQGLNYYCSKISINNKSLFHHAVILLGLIAIQVISGAFVAGTNAGMIYNSFPLMDGKLIPDGLFFIEPWYNNFSNNHTTIQFSHRLIALLVTIVASSLIIKILKFKLNKSHYISILPLTFALTLQIALGIMTLLQGVPLSLALMHQLGALLLYSAAIFLNLAIESKVT